MERIDLTKRIVRIGLMAAISIIIVWLVRFPIFPATPFLEYDGADIPIFASTFMFGTSEGLILTLIVSIIQGLTVSASSGIIGIIMHIFATGCFVLVAGLIFRIKKTMPNAILAIVLGTITMTATMVLWNLIFTPLYLGIPASAVIPLLPFIAAFNLIKAGVNGIVAFGIFKTIKK